MPTFIGGVDPEKEFLYQLFVNYFQNPILFYSPVDSTGEYHVFITKIHSMLLNENRYLVVMCKKNIMSHYSAHEDDLIKRTWKLMELKWHVLQTRHIENPEKYSFVVNHHAYSIMDTRQSLGQHKIDRVESNKEWSRYMCHEFPQLTIYLLHQQGSLYEYAHRGNIMTALETFRTIVQIEDTDYSTYLHIPPSSSSQFK